MEKGIKVIFETHRGERVERTLKVIWNSDACLDLKAFHSDAVGEDLKAMIAEMIVGSLDKKLVTEMLTELETRAAQEN